ncbi:MAG TPA: metallophosphoesterase [Prevotella sp.]
MKMWAVLFFLLPLIGVVYILWHVWQLLPVATPYKIGAVGLLLAAWMMLFVNFLFNIDAWNMSMATFVYEVGTSSLFILLYAVMLFLLLDLGRLVHLVPSSFLHNSLHGSIFVGVVMTALFVYGNLNYRHKVRMPLTLTTRKELPQPMKIVMMSDLHLGYHNDKKEFARWVDMVNADHADLILIGGDIIDRHIRPLLHEDVAQEFHRLNAPVYACLGNHEYYAGNADARKFYEEAGIHLLIDSVAEVNGINIIGRDDRTNQRRKSLKQLMATVDTSRYTIVLDHQPYHLEEAQREVVDFQLSGHTHYGQVWPVSWIEDAIYEDAYGPLQKGNTRYFVTSGIGIWGGKFRIGTQSEYLVASLRNE